MAALLSWFSSSFITNRLTALNNSSEIPSASHLNNQSHRLAYAVAFDLGKKQCSTHEQHI